eukprot:CAMPEP_0197827266 /NCGR_PEP_ID=MMETSP1437-20131217/4082_1 /TAXON_ID=49252 ORGANISM="Eucampia antarctica, Strain CCMP1452" /NCGR_SAMPLE_ID=MMETSP1437 /ASSEMBLY_ACC=CAM_ASM_001096 /LENGTH=204 /DNA_ID=CAMNT_0043428041 /DNA_START=30 /DNA_END=644 /DNA_ORIENTATION=-
MAPSRLRIPAHVFVFGLASVPGIFYALYWQKNHKSDEEFESMLKEQYGHNIRNSKERRTDMMQVLESMKNNDVAQDRKFAEVLQGGKGQVKRYSAVDARLYGTAKGVALREEHEQKTVKEKTRDPKKVKTKKGGENSIDRRARKLVHKDESKNNGKESSETSEMDSNVSTTDDKLMKNSIASGTLLLAAIAISGLFLGSKGEKP